MPETKAAVLVTREVCREQKESSDPGCSACGPIGAGPDPGGAAAAAGLLSAQGHG